jgi:hypothetical protein
MFPTFHYHIPHYYTGSLGKVSNSHTEPIQYPEQCSIPDIAKLKWIPQPQRVAHILILMAVWKAELYTFDKFSTESYHNSSTADSSPTWVCTVWSPFPIFFVILGALHLIGRCSSTCATPPALPCARYFWIGSCKLFAQGWLIFPGLAWNHDPLDVCLQEDRIAGISH